jgi:hypothetical protein
MAPPPLATDLPLRSNQGEVFALHEERPVARATSIARSDLNESHHADV